MRSLRIRMAMLCLGAASLVLHGCGGGSGGSSGPPTFSTTVIDGAIFKALVCLDKNRNGACDATEPQSETNREGKVSFTVDSGDLGQYPVLAVVDTNAEDAVHGPVTTRFTMSAPADQAAVVSPITTLVQQVIVETGVTTAAAAESVRSLTGLNVSVFIDYTAAGSAPSSGTNPDTLARMLVVTAQEQRKVIASVEGGTAADGKTIQRADLDRAIQKKLLERMPAILTAITKPSVLNASSAEARSDALLAAATTLATDSSALTLAGIGTVVAINNEILAPPPVTPYVPSGGATLANFSFTDAANFSARFFTSSVAQDTPDANNRVRYVDRRYLSVGGNLAVWGIGSQPRRQSDLNWNGSAWVDCPINFEGMSTVRDAQGSSSYTFCDNRETGTGKGARFDVSGKTMLEVYNSVIAAGFTNFFIANPAAALGSATFPTGSTLRYSANTTLTSAPAYYPAGKESPPALSNTVNQYTAAVCTTNEGNGTTSTTLEGMVAAFTGNPCVGTPGDSFVYDGQTYTNPDPVNEAWFAAAVSLGTLGSAPVGSGPAPGFFTTNTKFRVAFKGTGTNPTVYYACKERFNTGSTRNCTPIGTGSYTITTLGDARVMTFNNLPAQLAPLNFNQVYVERGGAVFYGFQTKLGVANNARLNTVAGNALLAQLGMPTVNPSVPLALTAGSYQGTWDAREAGSPPTPNYTTVVIRGDGSATCRDSDQTSSHACTVTITNPATGAFMAVDGSSTITGTLNHRTGIGSGTFNDLSSTPPTGNFVAYRR